LYEQFTRNRLFVHLTESGNNRKQRCLAFYRLKTIPMKHEDFLKAEEAALQLTKALKKKGLRRAHPESGPPIRLDGPLLADAFVVGVSFSHGLKCPPKPKVTSANT
jgi:hypothetical protein